MGVFTYGVLYDTGGIGVEGGGITVSYEALFGFEVGAGKQG
jgi:hypothetical protein